MTQIRTKLILIFLGIALLPLLPIIWLVNDLVHQSYHIGVNPQVETALENGVAYSRELYQRYKTELAGTLTGWRVDPENPALPPDAPPWQFLSLRLYDPAGQLRAEAARMQELPALNEGHFAQLAESEGGKMVFSDREANRFVALERRTVAGQAGFVALVAALDADFLAKSEQSLQVYQLYRTLALSPAAVPRQFLLAFLLVTAVVVLGTVGIAIRLSRRITGPIGELVRGTQEIGRGNLDYRLQTAQRDEIGTLVQHFNRMAGELKSYQQRTIYLEKMATWQEIARRLAHEIKNPLTPIQLTIQEMVDQYDGSDPEYAQLLRECHGIIHEEIENLRRLVREFSDFGRLPELHLAPGDLHALVREVRKLYPHREIRLNLDRALPTFLFDADRLRQVLINLIENAIQADLGGGPIEIDTRPGPEQVEITVRDHGPGIPPQLREKIFQPYFSTKKSGIGLGLAITRKMVEEHGGEIAVDAAPEGGSVFTIRLPLNRGTGG